MNKTIKYILFYTLILLLPTVHGQILTFEEAKAQADSGNPRCQAIVAMHYSLGWQTPKDPQKAVEYALKSARAGEALGLFRMGTLLRNGEGVPKNEAEGLKLQLEAVKLWNNQQNNRLQEGDPYCLTAAGILIFQGKVVEDSQQNRYNNASQLYRKAADAGLAPAQYNYAMCLIEGHGVEKNLEEAVKYIVLSAASNYPLSMKWLQEKDATIASATTWLKEKGINLENTTPTDASNPTSHNNQESFNKPQESLSQSAVQQSNSPEIKKYDFISFKENKEKADAGDPRAQAIVSWHYEIGWETDKNINQAIVYAEKSAEQSESIGLARLGLLLSNNRGINDYNRGQDYKKKAIAGIIQLANSGDPYALTILAKMMFDGEMIPRPGALVLTAREEADLNIIGQNKQKALELYKIAADMGFAPAQHQYALYKLDGVGCDKNDDEFIKYATRAKSLNFKPSIDLLESYQKANKSGKNVEILSVTNIADILFKLPSLIQDSTLLNEIALAPVDAKLIKHDSDGNKFISESVAKADYIKLIANQFSNISLPSIKDLKQEPELYQLALKCLQLPYLNQTQKSQLRAELENENTQYIRSSPAYCATGSGYEGAWISLASGILLLDTGGDCAFIPRDIISNSESFSVVINKDNKVDGRDLPGDENVAALVIHTRDNGKFAFPPHISFSNLIAGIKGYGMPGDKNPLDILAYNFTLHKVLLNLSILQNYSNASNSEIDRNAPGILGYPSINIGMEKPKCEKILKSVVDYKKYHALQNINCQNPNDFIHASVKRGLVRVINDFQVASNGLALVPPWEFVIMQPKELPHTNARDYIENTLPLDIFAFKNNILVFIARYSFFEERSSQLFDDHQLDGEKCPKDNSHLKAFLEKYGESPIFIGGMFGHNSSKPSIFQCIWKDKDLRIGAIFNHHGGFNVIPGQLKPADRVAQTNNGSKIGGYGSVVPISAEELDFSREKSSLRAAFYWSQNTAQLINGTSQEYFNKIKQKQEESQQQKNQQVYDSI